MVNNLTNMEKKYPCNICGKCFTSTHMLKYHETHVDCRKTVRCNRCGVLKRPVDPKHDKECRKKFEHASFQSVEDSTKSYKKKIKLWCNLCKVTSYNRNWSRHEGSNKHQKNLRKLIKQRQTRKKRCKSKSIDDSESSTDDGSEIESEQDSYVIYFTI